MVAAKGVEIYPLEAIQGQMAQFYTPQSSDETMLVRIPGCICNSLFVHRSQTDQLLPVRGSFVLAVLENRTYRYIPMNAQQPQAVKIPPGVPHGAINPNDTSCLLVNAVLRHRPPHARDYVPIEPPVPYDVDAARAQLQATQVAC
ncbi:MAG: dTDP-4-dehydrorhamnose 3,5-epimerase [Cyanobacteria bacterium QS_8_64_29]|nr:MAG: dTDP-4-dehydrorhamnose 3,5-epimerase [Cyanobacteria bacterium QS_8_64_29]